MTDTFITGTKLINEVVRTVCHTYLLLEEIISFPDLINIKKQISLPLIETIQVVVVPIYLTDLVSVLLQSSEKYNKLVYRDKKRIKKFFQKLFGYSLDDFYKRKKFTNFDEEKINMYKRDLMDNYGKNYLDDTYLELFALAFDLNIILLDKSNSNLEIKLIGNANVEYICLLKYKNIVNNSDIYFYVIINGQTTQNYLNGNRIYTYFQKNGINLPNKYDRFIAKKKNLIYENDDYYTEEEINNIDKKLDQKYYKMLEEL